MHFISQMMLFSTAIISASPADDDQIYDTPGVYTWIAPPKVRSISIVAVGGGASPTVFSSAVVGGGGGGLVYKNNIQVNPGSSYTVEVGAGGQSSGSSASPILGSNGGYSSFTYDEETVIAYGGISDGTGGNYANGTGGGNGGSAGQQGSGGGGAGGYTGDGGNGGSGGSSSTGSDGSSGLGGAGGGGGGSWQTLYFSTASQPARSSSGGGVGLYGQGSNGFGGIGASSSSQIGNATPAGGGSGGQNGDLDGGLYGGGGRSGFIRFGVGVPTLFLSGGAGGNGAVRIIWPGNSRAFPSINTQ